MKNDTKIKTKLVHFLMLLSVLVPQFFNLTYLPTQVSAAVGDFQVTQDSGGAFKTTTTTLEIDPEGDGTYISVNNGDTVADKTNVRMRINWALDNDKKTAALLSTPTVFENLPAYFYVPNGGMSGTIYGSGVYANTPFATYTITPDRKITLNWKPIVLSLDDVSGYLDINTWFEFSETGTDETIDLGHVGGGVVTINPQPDGDAKITKKQTAYDKETGIITWEILVNEGAGQNQSLSNLIIKDDYGTDQEFVSATLSKKEKGASDWQGLLMPSGYTEVNNAASHEVTWTIQPQDNTLSRGAYKVVVQTHITNPEATKITNKASFKSGNDGWEDVNSGEFDVAQGTGVISKNLDRENGQDKIKYFKTNGDPATVADYDYALLYWTIKVYYPIDGSLNNPIEDYLAVTPTEAGTHTYEQGSVVIAGLNNQTDASSFTKAFGTNGSGQAKMTITPPQVPFARRNYQVTYTTRFTKDAAYMTAHPDQVIVLGNHAKITGIGDSRDGGYIVPEKDFGIEKHSDTNPSPANHMTSGWSIRYNTTNQEIVNGKIVDSYLLYKNDWERFHPDFIGNDLYNKFKWIFYKRELKPETLKVSTTRPDGTPDHFLVKDVDYTLKMRNLDDDENLLLPDGSKLYAGLGYESGFEIQLLGAYKTSLAEDLLITFDAHESVSAYKGYLNSWDTEPNSNPNFDWPGLAAYYDYWSHAKNGWMANDPWCWDIQPDGRFFNKVTGYWGEHQENSEMADDYTYTGWLEIYNDLNGKKSAFRVPEGYDFEGGAFQTLGGLNEGEALYLFGRVRKMTLNWNWDGLVADNSSDGATEPPLYHGKATEEMVGFTTTFNTGQAPLPAGTTFSDDLSHLETADLGGNETSYHYVPGSVRVVETVQVYGIYGWGHSSFYAAIGRVTPEAIANGAENRPTYDFVEGVDYEVQYDEQTKVLKVVFLKPTNKTFNVIFLMTMSHDNPLGQDPFTNQNYKNIAKLTVPGNGDSQEATTDGTWGFETDLVNKAGTLGTEEGEKDLATWQVQVNPSGYAFQQLLFTDEVDASQTYLKDANGLPLVNVYEAVKDGTGGFTKGQLLTAGTDYQLIPKNIAVSMGSKHFDENAMANMAAKKGSLPAYPNTTPQNLADGKIFQYWNRDILEPAENGWMPMPVDGVNGTISYRSYTPQPQSNRFIWGAYAVSSGVAEASYGGHLQRIAELGYRFFTGSGGKTGYEDNYGNEFTEARIKNTPDEFFQITFGENRVYGDDEARDNRTFIVEYVTKVKAGATPSKLQNEATVSMWDQITIRQGEKVEHVYSSSGGGAQGINFNLTIVKDDGELEGVNPLNGARVRLEKKMGSDYQAIYPEGANALGEFDITGGQITRSGLTQGYYRLTELQAPDGYQLLSEPIYFKLTAVSGQAVWQEVDVNGTVIDDPNFDFGSEGLILKNDKLKRDLTVEKQWDFSASNDFVQSSDLPYYVVKVEVYREGTGQIGDLLPTKVASLDLTQANSFKATVTGLPMTDITGTATYHYYAREVDIIDSRNNQSILTNFETTGGDDHAIGGDLTIGSDTYDSANRIVNDSNGNFYIIMKNTLEERELGDFVKVGFKKEFRGDASLISNIDHVEVELYRKTASGAYQYQTKVTLNASNAWKWASGLLDKAMTGGDEYTYYIKETGAYTSGGDNLLVEFDSSAADYTPLTAVPSTASNSVFENAFTTIVNQSTGAKWPVTGGPGFKMSIILMTLAVAGAVFLYHYRQKIRTYKHDAS